MIRMLMVAMTLLFVCPNLAISQSFLPPNNLHLEDEVYGFTGINETSFNKVIDKMYAMYAPIVEKLGGTLVITKKWKDSTVNAYADRDGNIWNVTMFGGLARRSEISADGFAMVIAHELGHHLGGYPFYDDTGWPAADEGNSDYFAAHAGLKKYFENDTSNVSSLPQVAINKCKATYEGQARRVCFHVLAGAKSCVALLSALGNDKASFSTFDPSQVTATSHTHPRSQCRLDTMVAGAMCKTAWDDQHIPPTYSDAMKYSCENGAGARPKCWFKD